MEKLNGFADLKKPEITPYPALKIAMLAIADNSSHTILQKREKSTDGSSSLLRIDVTSARDNCCNNQAYSQTSEYRAYERQSRCLKKKESNTNAQ